MSSCYAEESCEYAFYDFGTVSTGTRAFKSVQVLNTRTIAQCYDINRDPDTNPLDHSFDVKPYVSPEIKPGESFTFEIEYYPVVPFTISYDYFNVTDSYGVCYNFGVKGKSLGPLVEISVRELILCCIGSQTKAEKTIILSNDSVDVAKFQFDVDDVHYFEVNPREGVIEPRSQIVAKIKFIPPRPGVYSRYLFCLIQYQSPLMIDVVGIHTYDENFKVETVPLRRYLHHEALEGGYESYVSDNKHLVEYPPPVVLSKNCVDFGQTFVNGTQNLAQTVCVTSYIKTGCTLEWEEDPFGIFLIEPARTKILQNASAIFEVFFRPNTPDYRYSRELIARIHWDEQTTHDSLTMKDIVNDLAVPLVITLRLMGHTFEELSSIPRPMYNLHSTSVCMPPCVPPVSVYNTFCIGNVGTQPLMFKFIPPTISYYVLKPMQGVIKHEFQIIVAGVCPNKREEVSYLERWILQFNGSQMYEVSIDLSSYAEYPKIHINEENTVTFPPTFPGTEQNGKICLKNFTRHYIWYRFTVDEPESELFLTDEEGSIASNEITYITWKFIPKEEGSKIIPVTCDTCALLDCWCPFGTFVGTAVSVFTESEYNELVSLPSEIDCEVIGYKKTIDVKLYLFNFGRCKVYFSLKCIPLNNGTNFVKRDLVISPVLGKIEPFDNISVSVSICPSQLGEYAFAVAYAILPNGKSTKNVLNERIPVTTITYECVLPQVQIADINYLGGGPLISKLWLWRLMNVNCLNNILRDISPGESLSVQLNLPHGVLNSEPLTMYVLFHNISEVKALWSMRKIIKCNCVIREDYMTKRVFKHQCEHRDQIWIYPSKGELMAHDEMVLMIKVKYIVPGQNETTYLLKLGDNRNVTISFVVFSLPKNICSPSVYTSSLSFQGTYVGEDDPCIQAFWLYNSAHQPAFYYIDQKALRQFNVKNMSDIITCVNPSGTVPPQSTHPILFQFAPKALDSYEVHIPLCLGTQYYYSLSLNGEGNVTYQNRLQKMTSLAPRSSIFDLEEISVFLSTDHFLVGPFLTHSQEECCFFIENRTSTVSVGYSWQKYVLPDFLTCIVEPSQGNLQPGESEACIVKIISHSRPCLITIPISCEFINLDLCQRHEEAQNLFQEIQRRQEDIFTITEKGFFKPECKITLSPLPKPFYRVLTVSCHVTNRLRVDAQLTLSKQLQLYPPGEAVKRPLTLDERRKIDINTLNVIRQVIDTLIWDTMFNDRFQNAVQHIKSEDSLFYGQFVMDSRKERELVSLQRHTIPRNIIAKIIREIIYDVFKTEYNLDRRSENPDNDVEDGNEIFGELASTTNI